MNAAIIAVGSELLTPDRMDTNSLYLTGQLNALGVEVVEKMVLGDHRQRLAAAIGHAAGQAELVILSGGLGPTEDDLTREAAAEYAGRGLEFRPEILEAIEQRFRRMNRKMADVNRRQAYVVQGAAVLPNPRGTAPGLWLEHEGRHIVMLPGPPRELQSMFEEQCVPRLKQLLPPQVIRTRLYRVAGMPESDLDQLIAPIYRRWENPATTILAGAGDIEIHLRARAASEEEAEALLRQVGDPIAEALGERIYSRNGGTLEETVGDLLRRQALTLSVAESCTGGMLAERITRVAGSSEYFVGGFLVYNDAMKTALLGVPPELLLEHRAVSEPVARAMALGAQERTGSDVSLSVTGVAGPSQGEEMEPVGTVYIGLAAGGQVTVRRFQFGGDRQRVRMLCVVTAMDMLRRRLTRSSGMPWN